MAELTYREAVAYGIAQEMRRDPRLVMLGEDIAAAGGVFKTTVGLLDEFGPTRVRDTPISEQAILGAAMGAAMTGVPVIAEIMFSDFLAVCWDIVANEIAKSRYMTDGQVSFPLVIRTANGGGVALRRPALPERRELGDDDPRPQGGGAVDAAGRGRSDGGGDSRSRPRRLLRAQVADGDEGRRARRRDRRPARDGQDRADGNRRHDRGPGADGAPGRSRRPSASQPTGSRPR